MIKIIGYLLVIFVLFVSVCSADICVTQGGSCQMAQNGLPMGSSCFCPSPWGPVSGQVMSNYTNQQAAPPPAFCCTPAGRLGPFNNPGIPVGGQCVVPTTYGVQAGQACY